MANDKIKGASASKKRIATRGSYFDVRLAILRTDFNPDKHGDSVSFWADDEPLFQDESGKLDQDCQVALGLFGFDEPFDGMSISIISPEGRSSILYREDTDEMEADIERLLKYSFVSDIRFAQAITKIVTTSWGFGGDYDDVKEEALDQLEDFSCVSESGTDMLNIEDPLPGGGVLIDVAVYSDVPATIESDGAMEFPEDIEWDEFLGDRFICLLLPKYKSSIHDIAAFAQTEANNTAEATPALDSEKQESPAGTKSAGLPDSGLDKLLKKDMFETDEEFQYRLSRLAPIPIGIIELKDDGYDIDNQQFSIQITWSSSSALESLPLDRNGVIIDIPREPARMLWTSGKEHPLLASFKPYGRKAIIDSLYIGWDTNQYPVAAGIICQKTSTEVQNTVLGLTKEVPVKLRTQVSKGAPPAKIQPDIVKSINAEPDDKSDNRFPVWTTFQEGPLFPEMIVLPAGSFMMGSDDHESEQPIKRIELKRPFCMGIYPVTFDEFDKFLELNYTLGIHTPDDRQQGRGRRPVSGVSWKDALAYCEWLSKITKATYRLPSEAEWEYAARAGTTTRYWWGDDLSDGARFYAPKPPRGKIDSLVAVGSFEPNPWGIHDLIGNVDQWCQDIHDINNEFTPLDGSPRFNSLTHKQIQEQIARLGNETFYDVKRIRGGRFNSIMMLDIKTVSENRHWGSCEYWAYEGFRVVREI